MNDKISNEISGLRSLARKYGKEFAGLKEADILGPALQDEAKEILGHLAGLPAGVLALPQKDDGFPPATAQKLRALASVRTKIELLPGVKVRQQTELARLRVEIHAAVKALAQKCADEAATRLEKEDAEIAGLLSKYLGGDSERAKAATTLVTRSTNGLILGVNPTPGSETARWLETWLHFDHNADPVLDAERAIRLAEAFDRNEPCT
jgi:hypothetical protein